VHDKYQWDAAVKFVEECVKERVATTETLLRDLIGPGAYERWTRWAYPTPEQSLKSKVKTELDQLLVIDANHVHPCL